MLLLSSLLALSPETPQVYCAVTSKMPMQKLLSELGRFTNHSVVLSIPDQEKCICMAMNGTVSDILSKLSINGLNWQITHDTIYVTDTSVPQLYNVEISPDSTEVWNDIDTVLNQILGNKNRYAINSHTGTVSVLGSDSQKLQIAEYLKRLNIKTKRQAWIQVNIITVKLNKECETGINIDDLWQAIMGSNYTVSLSGNSLTFSGQSDNLRSVCRALEKFGTVRMTSNITLSAAHDQTGELHAKSGMVFFTLKELRDHFHVFDPKEKKPKEKDVQFTESQVNRSSIGTSLYIKPHITDNGATLAINFSISSLSGWKHDPVLLAKVGSIKNGALANYTTEIKDGSRIPITAEQSMKTTVNLKTGQAILIGGLQSTIRTSTVSGPFARINLLSMLFGQRRTQRQNERTYVYLRLIPEVDASVAHDSRQHDCKSNRRTHR